MELSRRDLLTGLLAFSASACVGRVGARRIEGSIVGPSRERGHRLRDGPLPRAGDRRERVAVAVVGAGVAGLSTAWALERAGLRDLLVLELEDAAGGTARGGVGRAGSYPWGAHYVPAPTAANAPLVRLLAEVGAVERIESDGRPVFRGDVPCRDPQERLFHGGAWREGLEPVTGSSAEDRRQLEALAADFAAWARRRDDSGRRAFAVPRAHGSDAPEVRALDEISMARYLDDRGLTSGRLRWLVEYGCRDDFGATLEQTSAWAGVHYHAARVDPGTGRSAELLTWPEGNARLVSHMASVAGARLRTGALVTALEPVDDGVLVEYLDVRSGQVRGIQARHVACALPRFLLPRVVVPWRRSPPEHVAAFRYGSWMVANLTLSDRPREPGFPLAWDNVLRDSPSLGYVVSTHQTGRDHGPTTWTYYLPLTGADVSKERRRLERTSWQEWVDLVVADLERAHPDLTDVLERVDVVTWGHAMVRPGPGFAWSEALEEARRPLGAMRFAHCDLSALPLFEEAQYWGLRAARDVLRAEGMRPPGWLE